MQAGLRGGVTDLGIAVDLNGCAAAGDDSTANTMAAPNTPLNFIEVLLSGRARIGQHCPPCGAWQAPSVVYQQPVELVVELGLDLARAVGLDSVAALLALESPCSALSHFSASRTKLR